MDKQEKLIKAVNAEAALPAVATEMGVRYEL